MHVGLFTTFTRLPAPGQNTRIDKDTSKPAGGMYIYVAEGLVGWLVGGGFILSAFGSLLVRIDCYRFFVDSSSTSGNSSHLVAVCSSPPLLDNRY